jgi:hypothetical protein
VGFRHVFQAGEGVLGKGSGAPGGHGDVKGHLLGGCDQSIARVEVLKEVQALLVKAQELPAYGEVLPEA